MVKPFSSLTGCCPWLVKGNNALKKKNKIIAVFIALILFKVRQQMYLN
jgi:hypothetical protein